MQCSPEALPKQDNGLVVTAHGYHSLSDGERTFRGAKGDYDKFTVQERKATLVHRRKARIGVRGRKRIACTFS